MNCPVCDRILAPALSICPACGAMMNDTVREELQSMIMRGNSARIEPKAEGPTVSSQSPLRPRMISQPVAKQQATANLSPAKTSPTLVEFQNKNASLPDWRLQLQNAVQQRKGSKNANPSFPTNSPPTLNAEVISPVEAETADGISDPRVVNALRRIAESRKAFLQPETILKKASSFKPARTHSFPFDVVAPNGRAATAAAPAKITVNAPPKPKLVVPPPITGEPRDTKKLQPFVETPETTEAIIETGTSATEFADIKRIRIKADPPEDTQTDQTEDWNEEIEDLAPFSMRFGAGLFDLIIGAFATMLVLSPLAFADATWSTAGGLMIFFAAWTIVLFLYMTICQGFYGKTIGMRLFSLELVDTVENEYPTLHQAAVNSSVFLLSLGLGGAGFLTVLFNEERRALHDLASGTILVREF